MLPLLKFMRIIGQGQLIRRQIAYLLQFNCQMDAHLLYQSLDTFNHTLINEIRRHYHEPEKYSYPSNDNMILYETTVMMMIIIIMIMIMMMMMIMIMIMIMMLMMMMMIMMMLVMM